MNERDNLYVLSSWLGNSKLESDALRKVENLVNASVQDVLGRTNPWRAVSAEERRKAMGDHFAEVYRTVIGDPNDPKIKAAIAAEAAAYRSRKDSPESNLSPDELLDRQLRDRAARRRGGR